MTRSHAVFSESSAETSFRELRLLEVFSLPICAFNLGAELLMNYPRYTHIRTC